MKFFSCSECMVLGCLASWAVNVLFQWDALPFYLVHILVWFLSDWIMLSVVQVSFRSKQKEKNFTSLANFEMRKKVSKFPDILNGTCDNFLTKTFSRFCSNLRELKFLMNIDW